MSNLKLWWPQNYTTKEVFVIKQSRLVQNATKRIKQILDAQYNKINLNNIVMSLNYLKDKHKNSLLELLQNYDKMFDGTLGRYTGSDYTAKPYHAKSFLFPKVHEPTLKKKIDRLIKIGVLKKINGQLLLLLYLR